MAEHVVVGAGSIGTNVALRLAGRGAGVRIVTRSGSGPEHPLIERVAADASDAARLTELSRGAAVIYHCANPPTYLTWERLLPPLQTATIAAARTTGAVLALTGSLYAYGPQPDGRMTEHTPSSATDHKGRLRKRMWDQARTAGIRTVEVRGSHFIGKDAASFYSLLIEPAVRAGRPAWVPADLDAPHSFTFNGDMAQALITLAADERAWGRPWHVPSPPAVSVRDLVRRYDEAAGRPPTRLIRMPRFVMRTAGLVVPIVRETAQIDYQWYAPYVMDATETATTFGLTATDLDTAVRDEAGVRV